MRPLLTFASGLLAGIVGIRLLKTVKLPENLRANATARLDTLGDKARHGFDKAETGLRQATVSGLETIEKSSASLRSKLTPSTSAGPVETPPDVPAGTPAVETASDINAPAKAKRRSPRKKSSPAETPPTGTAS